jgi:hypothetical protein
LVALSKDLNRRYDQYESKLMRLERAAAAAAQSSAGRTFAQGGEYQDGGADNDDQYQQYDVYASGNGNSASDASQGGRGGHGAAGYDAHPGRSGYASDAPVGAYDDGRSGSHAESQSPDRDRGFGSSNDRYAAPANAMGGVPTGTSPAGRGPREEDFADADLSDLLTE